MRTLAKYLVNCTSCLAESLGNGDQLCPKSLEISLERLGRTSLYNALLAKFKFFSVIPSHLVFSSL